ncbi:hydrolase TatD family [Clostridium sp. CAG:609]|nr:hydrolase TatD family [Clostridium sp. CAG:609]
MFVDTHCHIFKSDYDNIDEVLNNASNNNVKYYINNGSDREYNKEVLELVKEYDNMYGALGIHPETVDDYSLDDIEFIKNNLSNKKIVAIGEIGLDYHYTKENKDEQIKLLEMQLSLAEEYNLPVIIHSRDATEDIINTLKKFNCRGTIHSFSGSLETAKIYIKMGYLLGVNGVITFNNCNIKDVIKEVGLDNIVLETDSPYLTPVPYRGMQNNPSHILDIAKFVSELYNVSLEELSYRTNENIKRMYERVKLV